MIYALGTDIIEIQRIKESVERRGEQFLRRILTPSEYDYCMRFNPPYARVAGRFAGKEAISKALGTGIGGKISWLDIEILNESSGKPTVILSKKAYDMIDLIALDVEVIISISHSKEFATATALLQTRSQYQSHKFSRFGKYQSLRIYEVGYCTDLLIYRPKVAR